MALQRNRLLDPDLRRLKAAGKHAFVDLGGSICVILEAALGATRLDHHHGHIAVLEFPTGHDQFERTCVALGICGVRDPCALDGVRDTHCADRPLEGDARNHQRRRRSVDRQHIVRILLISAEHRGHDLCLVAEAFRERRTQRTVGESAGEDRLFGGAAFATEERTGNLSGGVRPLFDIDGQREEIDAGTDTAGCVCRGQHTGAADDRDDGALALRGKLPGLERDGAVGTRHGRGHANWISHDGLLSGSYMTRL